MKSIECLQEGAQKPAEEAAPGSPDSGGSGRDEAPSQLEELADFMGQVCAFSLFCFNLMLFLTAKYS